MWLPVEREIARRTLRRFDPLRRARVIEHATAKNHRFIMGNPSTLRADASTFSRREVLRLFGAAGLATVLLPSYIRAAVSSPTAASPTNAPHVDQQPGFYRFRIGAIEALALSDGGMVAPGDKLWTGGTAEKITADLEAAAMPTASVELPFAVLLVRIGAELILIDAGSGGLFGPASGHLPANLLAAGVAPTAITAIVITHAHRDHVGGLLDPKTQAPVFPNAKLFINRREYDYWTSASPDLSEMVIPEPQRERFVTAAQKYLHAFDGRWQLIAPGDKLIDGLELVDAPGHTPGHLAVIISSGRDQLLHLADTVHHHALSFANPEWFYNYDSQPKLAAETRRRILDRAAAERLRVFGSHLPFPGLGRVRKTGAEYQHLIEPWQSVPLT